MQTNFTSSIFESLQIHFEPENLINSDFKLPLLDEYQDQEEDSNYFGILQYKVKKNSIYKRELFFIFTIDCSASMLQTCSDNEKKINHILKTLENIILLLVDQKDMYVCISIYTFDHDIYPIVEEIVIDNDSLNFILQQIKSIEPHGMTNIQKPLINADIIIGKYLHDNPEHEIYHLFMTDGEVNKGMDDPELLKKIVNNKACNLFIGFGIGHNSHLLHKLSSESVNRYYFIDKLKNAGLVYGEIIHNILYKSYSCVNIHINNGFIYDWKLNKWVKDLFIGNVISEDYKTFQIITLDPSLFSCEINGNKIDNVSFHETITNNNSSINSVLDTKMDSEFDLTKYKFRLHTLHLLYQIIGIHYTSPMKCERKRMITYNQKRTDLFEKLQDMLQNMKHYMENNSLQEDELLLSLCDDIYIAYSLFNSKYGSMYCLSRMNSQGFQSIYSVTQIPETNGLGQGLGLGFGQCLGQSLPLSLDIDFDDNFDLDVDLDTNVNNNYISNHVMSRNISSFASQDALFVMRSVSDGKSSTQEL
jgi:hypothetical protein